MLVLRTAKGQVELRSRERGLLLRERSVLFLADGTKSLRTLAAALGPAFARGAPDQAERFRERLRQARDGRFMLLVAEDMLAGIEELAGWERAQTVRERIEALLPPADEGTQG